MEKQGIIKPGLTPPEQPAASHTGTGAVKTGNTPELENHLTRRLVGRLTGQQPVKQ